jgi:hypothetical protein
MRIHIIIERDNRFGEETMVFFIDDFPAPPHKGDRMNIAALIAGTGVDLNKRETEFLETHSFIVDFVSWQKDDEGIVLWVFCSGE